MKYKRQDEDDIKCKVKEYYLPPRMASVGFPLESAVQNTSCHLNNAKLLMVVTNSKNDNSLTSTDIHSL